MKIYGCLRCVLAFIIPAGAQQHIFKETGTRLGIPVNESYNIMQDSRGYLWLSTEAGLCRYNGRSLKVYGEKEGFAEKVCYGICEFPKGKMWVVTSAARVLLYDAEKDLFSEAPFSAAIKAAISENAAVLLYYIQPASDSTLWLNTQSFSFEVNIYTNEVKKRGKKENDPFTFLKTGYGIKPVRTHDAGYTGFSPGSMTLKINDRTGTDTCTIRIPWNEVAPQWRCYTAMNSRGEYFISWDKMLLRLSPGCRYQVYEMPNFILGLYCDKDDGLWVGAYKEGVFFFEEGQLWGPIRSLPGLSVSGITEDHEKGVWCTTLEKGVYYCRNKHIVSYDNVPGLDKKQQLLKSTGNGLYCSPEGKCLFRLSQQHVQPIGLRLLPDGYLSDIIPLGKGYLFAGSRLVYCDSAFRSKRYIKLERGNVYGAVSARQGVVAGGKILLAHNTLLLEYKGRDLVKEICWPRKDLSIYCLLPQGPDLLLGTSNGLYRLHLHDYSVKKVNGMSGWVTGMLNSRAGETWVVTKDNGVYVTHGGRTRNVAGAPGLKEARFYDICEDGLGQIWLAGNNGLTRIGTNRSTAETYGPLNGLPSKEVYKVAFFGGRIYFTTSEGLCSFGMGTGMKNRARPAIHLSRLSIKDQPMLDWGGVIQVPYRKNTLKLVFDVLTFKETTPPKVSCYLYGNDDTVLFRSGSEITLSNLEPGAYTLRAYGVNNDQVLSKTPVVLKFDILLPFWKTWWFMALCVLLLVTVVYGMIRLVIRRTRKREREKARINELISESQLTALQAQMNPHFIFNALNSIQTYILDNNRQAAYDYLARFALLVRMVLQTARETTVTLEREIEILKTYIDLEQMRFEDRFDCEWNIDPHLDTWQVCLPPMLMQPYIENAIWHGLMPMPKPQRGKLSIGITMRNENVHIVIQDNGIGRKRSHELKKTPGHQSVGLELSGQRVAVLNNLAQYKGMQVKVTDLYHADERAAGTRVEIILPYTAS